MSLVQELEASGLSGSCTKNDRHRRSPLHMSFAFLRRSLFVPYHRCSAAFGAQWSNPFSCPNDTVLKS